MQLLAPKKARFNLAIELLKTPTLIKLFPSELRFLGFSLASSFILFLLLFIAQPTNIVFSPSCFLLRILADHQQFRPIARLNSPIRLEALLNLLLAAYQKAKEKAKAKKGGNNSSQDSFNKEKTIFHTVFSNDSLSEAVNLTNKKENEQKDDEGKQFFS